MIKSVFYPTEGSGYLYDKYKKPEPLETRKGRSTRCDKEVYERELADYNEYGETYKHPLAAKLIGRKITFANDKINIIFGENASGKTTILKSLSAVCNAEDGWSSIIRPIDLMHVRTLGENVKKSDVKKYLNSIQPNTCNVEWDGAPIFRHNFGENTGAYTAPMSDECFVWWTKSKSRLSAMQKDMMFLCKVFNLMLIKVKFTNIFSNYIRKSEIWNDLWQSCVDAQVEYYNDFPMAQSDDLQNTYLFDEFDKHLSIANAINLYTEYLPNVFEKSKPQIILVSHSPIVLSKAVADTGIYNLVSLDEEYTETCKKRLAEIF